MEARTRSVRFPGASERLLAAKIDLPAGTPRAFAVFAHCFTCSKDFLTAARVSRRLADRGFGVLRLDFTGLGASEGDRPYGVFDDSVADVVAAAAHLRERYQAPALLVGHSFGGATTLAAAGLLPEVLAVATIAAPSTPAHVRELFGTAAEEIERAGEGTVELAGRRFVFGRDFLDSLADRPERRGAGELGAALLVLHAPGDTLVGVEHAARIFRAARHPKSYVSLDTADHYLSDVRDAHYAADLIAAWAEHYLP
ncbi:alpha/beta hydrolase family protein [Streptomyces sp. NPDC058486]|uniref:alpha/beta hydrolase family protein n=1 Tax=unclassified Streptomyces TaxID=2593676 RepID=UPI00364AE96F